MRLRVSIIKIVEGTKGLGWADQRLFGLCLRVSPFLWVPPPILGPPPSWLGFPGPLPSLHFFLCPPSDCSASRNLSPRKVLASMKEGSMLRSP